MRTFQQFFIPNICARRATRNTKLNVIKAINSFGYYQANCRASYCYLSILLWAGAIKSSQYAVIQKLLYALDLKIGLRL